MKLINFLNLYKFIKNNQHGELKEYSKSMSPDEVDGLRIKNPFIFKLIKWIVWLSTKGKKHNLGNTAKTPDSLLSKTDHFKHDQIDYVLDIIKTIDDWDILKHVDHLETDAKFITLDYNHKGHYDGFEDALHWTGILASSLPKIYSVHQDPIIKEYYLALLKGIDLCIKQEPYTILRHPLKNVKKDLEPISQDVIGGLLSVIAQFGKIDDPAIKQVEQKIKGKFNAVMSYHDYHLMFPDGTTNSYDLHPNLIYNHIRCFDYIGIRLSQGKFNEYDAKVLKEFLQILISEDKPPYRRSWYGLDVAVSVLEAIIEMYPDIGEKPEVDKILNKLDAAHLAIDWLKWYRSATPEVHPDLESVLHYMYRVVGHKDGKKETAKNVFKWINVLYDWKVLRKTNSIHQAYRDKVKFDIRKYRQEYALPPLLRSPSDYYWQRSAWRSGYSNEEHPVFEYLTPFSRILPFVYYPEHEGGDNK